MALGLVTHKNARILGARSSRVVVRLPELAPSAFFLGHGGGIAFHRKASATRPHTHQRIARQFLLVDTNNPLSQPGPLAVTRRLHVVLRSFWHLKPPGSYRSNYCALSNPTSGHKPCVSREMGLREFQWRQISGPRGQDRRRRRPRQEDSICLDSAGAPESGFLSAEPARWPSSPAAGACSARRSRRAFRSTHPPATRRRSPPVLRQDRWGTQAMPSQRMP